MNITQAILAKAACLQCLIFDVDGVLTDRKIYLSDQGVEMRAFNTFDGFGMKRFLKAGLEIAIITSRNSQLVARRMQEIGVKYLYQGSENKLAAYEDLLQKTELKDAQMAYVGDDCLDVPLIKRVGLGVVVADAHEATLAYADYQTQKKGGEGAAREVCDLILRAQNLYHKAYADVMV